MIQSVSMRNGSHQRRPTLLSISTYPFSTSNPFLIPFLPISDSKESFSLLLVTLPLANPKCCCFLSVCVKSLQLCPTLFKPMDCSLPDSSFHGIFQAGILEWIIMPSSRGSSRPRDWTHVSCISCIVGRYFIHWVTWEATTKIKELLTYNFSLKINKM